MIGHLHIIFAPLLPLLWLKILGGVAIALTLYAIYRRARGSVVRVLAFALLLLALSNPSVIEEKREPLKDTALVVVDESASMQLADRPHQKDRALLDVTRKLGAFNNLETEIIRIKGSEESHIFNAIEQKLTSIPHDRLAGIIAITDGQIHDKPEKNFGSPLHVLIAGKHEEIDRRIVIKEAPAYGLVDKKVTLTLRVEDEGKSLGSTAPVTFRRGNGESQTVAMPIGKDVQFEVPIDRAGQNLVVFSTEVLPGELTPINNTVSTTINGIRDRLRVLLISGQPHIGGRTWRNFLKADPAVDLIHFTILRSPLKQDSVPNTEMSLIAFPVRELFETKLNSFDLVIFDRFRSQSLVPDTYLENIARYVETGGALLISNNTDEGIPPLTLSPLARVLPAQPSGQILTGAFVPDLSEAGKRHPVTNALTTTIPRSKWGHWFRQTGSRAAKGEPLMTGQNSQPLLVLDHVGQGRVAQFLSDQFWLWSRGFEGGGPQAELLRRTAHWLVQEPELDETALRARSEIADKGWNIIITKQSLKDSDIITTITGEDNQPIQATLTVSKKPGVLAASVPVKQTGLYRIKDPDQEILVMVGPTNAPEFGAMRATEEKLSPAVKASDGSFNWLEDHPDGPEIRRTSATAAQQGWGWIGLKQNGQYRVTGSKAYTLLPAWAMLAILLGIILLMWRREGKG